MDEDYNPSNAKSKPPKELSESSPHHATKKVSEKKSETTSTSSSSSHKSSKEKSSAANNTTTTPDKKNYSFKLVPGSNKNCASNNSPKTKVVVADHSSTESIKQILNGESVVVAKTNINDQIIQSSAVTTKTESNQRNKNFPRSMDRSAPTTPTSSSQKPSSNTSGPLETITATSQPPTTMTATASSAHVPSSSATTTTGSGSSGSPTTAVVNAVVPTTTSTNSSLSLAKKIEVSTPKSGNFDVLGSIMKDMRK